jgi:hypothetical protein
MSERRKRTPAQLDREINAALVSKTENKGCGECFMYAYQFIRKKGGVLKHAMVTHPWDKNDFWHAWVEKNGKVHDWQTAEVRKTDPVAIEQFYAWWKPHDVRSYTADEAREQILKAKHYGPW